jgi:hypothetical protein
MKKYTFIIPYLLFAPLSSAASTASNEENSTQTQNCHRQPTSEAIYRQWYDALRQRDTDSVKRLYNQYQINANIPDPRDAKKYPPILVAIMTNNNELTEFFCKNGTIDLAVSDFQGRTVVHWAAIKNGLHIFQMIEPRCTPELLNLTDHDGCTALNYAERYNYTEIINFLRAHRNRSTPIPSVPATTSCGNQPVCRPSQPESQSTAFNDQVPQTQSFRSRLQQCGPRLTQGAIFLGIVALAHYDWRLSFIASFLTMGAYVLGYSNSFLTIF